MPAQPVRAALLATLQAGVVGTFDAIARHAGHPERQVSTTLRHMRREGILESSPVRDTSTGQPRRAGRPRVLYGLARNNPGPFDALSFAREVWR